MKHFDDITHCSDASAWYAGNGFAMGQLALVAGFDDAFFDDVLHQVRMDPSSVCDVKMLAGIASMAPVSLRRRFRKRFGVTLSDFMSDFRLDWAHERLTSGFESRPISEMAVAAGFRDSVAFTRAYKRRFGSSPSQSRAEAIKLMGVK